MTHVTLHNKDLSPWCKKDMTVGCCSVTGPHAASQDVPLNKAACQGRERKRRRRKKTG